MDDKVYTKGDVYNNIPGFSDTELKKFILINGLKFEIDSKPEKSLVDKFIELSTKDYESFYEMIAFGDSFLRSSAIFKFCVACHLKSMKSNKKYYDMYYQTVKDLESKEKGKVIAEKITATNIVNVEGI